MNVNAAAGTAPLEDRLRSMILTKSDDRQFYSPPAGANANPGTPPANYGYPVTASASDTAAAADAPPLALAGAPGSGPPPASPRSSRKRLNQAQRRQMSAQLSIPINPRPSPPNSAGNYISPPPYSNNHYSFHPHQQQHHHQNQYQHQYQHQNQQQQHGQFQGQHGHQQRPTAQRPQSATMRPSHYGHSPMPLTSQNNQNQSYPSQPRHHQSLSYQCPMMYDDPYKWRSHQHQSHQSHQASLSSFDAQSPRSARPHHHNHHNNHSQSRLYQTKPEEI